MKRFVISIILVVFLVGQPAQGSYFTLSNINQIQESLGDSSSPIPQEDNPEQAYPIEGNSPGESTEGLDPNQTYPIDGLAPDEGDDGAGGPLTFETVEIYSPP